MSAIDEPTQAPRMSLKWRFHRVSLAMTIWLVAVWVAVFASADAITVLGGILVSVAVQAILPLPTTGRIWHFRVGAFIWLLVRFTWDLILAGIHVSAVVLSTKEHDDGIVRCEMRSDNPVYLTLVAALCSMVPGTIVVEVRPEEGALYLHTLDLGVHGGIDGVKKETRDQEKRVLWALAPDRVLVETGLKAHTPEGEGKR